MICVIGLGYVGLPLVEALSKHFEVIGYDIDRDKVEKLRGTTDFLVTCNPYDFETTSIETWVICVPTPVDEANQPELSSLTDATETVGQYLKNGDLVIYESTVYPGCTETFCGPLLELASREKKFHLGYSPERINPGDTEHTIDRVTKIIAANTPEGLERMKAIYAAITTVHIAPSIKVAEAAKIIENIQRDVNIALINEFTMLLHEMDIPTAEVLAAARTKWNWLDFKPGLVGGHCIGVDPYYLTHAAQRIDFHSEMILAGRRTNDGIAKYVAIEVLKRCLRRDIVVIFGATFKKNVPDFRNSKVMELATELRAFGFQVLLADPYLEGEAHSYGKPEAIIYAVDHDQFADDKLKLRSILAEDGLLFDLTGTLPDADWSL